MADARKPHICFVAESRATYGLLMSESCDVVGGAELQQTLIASELQKLGYTVTFLVPDFGQPPKVITEHGITLIKTRQYIEKASPFRRLSDLAHLFKAMSAADADIYYQRTSSALTGLTALFSKIKRKPFVFSVAHNKDLDGSTAIYLKHYWNALYRYGVKHASAVVVQSEDQMRLLRERFIREGVLIRSTFSAPEKEVGIRKHVLWVGNLKPVKRPKMFLEIASRLPDYKFIMVGGVSIGCEGLGKEIKNRAKDIPNLELAGAIKYSQVGKYFDEAFVFVNTSSDEGFPNTYLQAWCRGVPVVGTFDADSLIKKHNLGRHCSTIDELANAVNELMQDESLRASIGENAVQYVKEHHSPESIADAYDNLFTGLWQ